MEKSFFRAKLGEAQKLLVIRNLVFDLLGFCLRRCKEWKMLKVTNHGHQRRAQQKHQTRTNTNCRESIFRWIFCLLSMAGRTLLLYEPLQCVPGGAIKYHQKREKFLRPQFILLAFSLELCVKKCKIISFFGVFSLWRLHEKHTQQICR